MQQSFETQTTYGMWGKTLADKRLALLRVVYEGEFFDQETIKKFEDSKTSKNSYTIQQDDPLLLKNVKAVINLLSDIERLMPSVFSSFYAYLNSNSIFDTGKQLVGTLLGVGSNVTELKDFSNDIWYLSYYLKQLKSVFSELPSYDISFSPLFMHFKDAIEETIEPACKQMEAIGILPGDDHDQEKMSKIYNEVKSMQENQPPVASGSLVTRRKSLSDIVVVLDNINAKLVGGLGKQQPTSVTMKPNLAMEAISKTSESITNLKAALINLDMVINKKLFNSFDVIENVGKAILQLNEINFEALEQQGAQELDRVLKTILTELQPIIIEITRSLEIMENQLGVKDEGLQKKFDNFCKNYEQIAKAMKVSVSKSYPFWEERLQIRKSDLAMAKSKLKEIVDAKELISSSQVTEKTSLFELAQLRNAALKIPSSKMYYYIKGLERQIKTITGMYDLNSDLDVAVDKIRSIKNEQEKIVTSIQEVTSTLETMTDQIKLLKESQKLLAENIALTVEQQKNLPKILKISRADFEEYTEKQSLISKRIADLEASHKNLQKNLASFQQNLQNKSKQLAEAASKFKHLQSMKSDLERRINSDVREETTYHYERGANELSQGSISIKESSLKKNAQGEALAGVEEYLDAINKNIKNAERRVSVAELELSKELEQKINTDVVKNKDQVESIAAQQVDAKSSQETEAVKVSSKEGVVEKAETLEELATRVSNEKDGVVIVTLQSVRTKIINDILLPNFDQKTIEDFHKARDVTGYYAISASDPLMIKNIKASLNTLRSFESLLSVSQTNLQNLLYKPSLATFLGVIPGVSQIKNDINLAKDNLSQLEFHLKELYEALPSLGLPAQQLPGFQHLIDFMTPFFNKYKEWIAIPGASDLLGIDIMTPINNNLIILQEIAKKPMTATDESKAPQFTTFTKINDTLDELISARWPSYKKKEGFYTEYPNDPEGKNLMSLSNMLGNLKRSLQGTVKVAEGSTLLGTATVLSNLIKMYKRFSKMDPHSFALFKAILKDSLQVIHQMAKDFDIGIYLTELQMGIKENTLQDKTGQFSATFEKLMHLLPFTMENIIPYHEEKVRALNNAIKIADKELAELQSFRSEINIFMSRTYGSRPELLQRADKTLAELVAFRKQLLSLPRLKDERIITDLNEIISQRSGLNILQNEVNTLKTKINSLEQVHRDDSYKLLSAQHRLKLLTEQGKDISTAKNEVEKFQENISNQQKKLDALYLDLDKKTKISSNFEQRIASLHKDTGAQELAYDGKTGEIHEGNFYESATLRIYSVDELLNAVAFKEESISSRQRIYKENIVNLTMNEADALRQRSKEIKSELTDFWKKAHELEKVLFNLEKGNYLEKGVLFNKMKDFLKPFQKLPVAERVRIEEEQIDILALKKDIESFKYNSFVHTDLNQIRQWLFRVSQEIVDSREYQKLLLHILEERVGLSDLNRSIEDLTKKIINKEHPLSELYRDIRVGTNRVSILRKFLKESGNHAWEEMKKNSAVVANLLGLSEDQLSKEIDLLRSQTETPQTGFLSKLQNYMFSNSTLKARITAAIDEIQATVNQRVELKEKIEYREMLYVHIANPNLNLMVAPNTRLPQGVVYPKHKPQPVDEMQWVAATDNLLRSIASNYYQVTKTERSLYPSDAKMLQIEGITPLKLIVKALISKAKPKEAEKYSMLLMKTSDAKLAEELYKVASKNSSLIGRWFRKFTTSSVHDLIYYAAEYYKSAGLEKSVAAMTTAKISVAITDVDAAVESLSQVNVNKQDDKKEIVKSAGPSVPQPTSSVLPTQEPETSAPQRGMKP